MSSANRIKGIIFIAAGVLLLLTGIVCFAGYLYVNIDKVSGALTRFKAPGSIEMKIDDPGRYGVYVEYRSFFDGRSYHPSSGYENLRLSVVSEDTGKEIEVIRPGITETYSLGRNKGYLGWAFYAETAGRYVIRAEYPESSGPDVILGIGKGFLGKVMKTVLVGFAILFGTIIICVILVFVGITELRKAQS
jgi:hypothetical protein